MKNAVIFGVAAVGVAVAVGLVLRRRAVGQSVLAEVMDEKVHQLQEKFMSLDETHVNPHSLDKLEQWTEPAG